MPMRLRLLLALMLFVADQTRAQCPSNPIHPPIYTDPQAYSNRVYGTCPAHPPRFPGDIVDCAVVGSYDLHAGSTNFFSITTVASASEGFICVSGAYGTMPVADLFMISGPASATPLAFDAKLRISGSRTADAPVGQVSFSTVTDSVVFTAPVSGFFDQEIVLHLSKLPGTPFQILVRPAAQGACPSGRTQLQTALTFALPAGYGITSCHGYQVAAVTRALTRTWRQVKSVYR